MGMLTGKRILLLVTGGIAAYKSAELLRQFIKDGAEVRVAMTKSATKFVSPLTFQSLSGKPVLTSLFDNQQENEITHIEAARWSHCLVIAPATANIIGKLANGIADDLVSTLALAARCQVILAPAMNWAMWQNEMVQQNIKKLQSVIRYSIIQPEQGELACGESGKGRLADLDKILDAARYAARTEKDLSGEMVLVTAGPTFEDIDPVRFVANRSSGKMGYAIAKEARARGAKVVLISGPTNLETPYGVELINVRTAAQMLEEVEKHFEAANIIIKSAAVADYKPARFAEQKIHKLQNDFHLAMNRTVDILKTLGMKKKNGQFLVGFAAETQQIMESGRKKLRDKKLDLIVVNDISQEGAGFDVDTNVVKLIDKKGHIDSLPKMDKSEVGLVLFDVIQKLRASNQQKNTNRKSGRKPRPRRQLKKPNSRAGKPVAKPATNSKDEKPAQNKDRPTKQKSAANKRKQQQKPVAKAPKADRPKDEMKKVEPTKVEPTKTEPIKNLNKAATKTEKEISNKPEQDKTNKS